MIYPSFFCPFLNMQSPAKKSVEISDWFTEGVFYRRAG